MTGEPLKEEAEVELTADPYVERGATIVSNPADGLTYQQADGTIWQQHTETDSNKIYWFNHATGESSWTKPPESVALEGGAAWQNPNKISPDQLLRDAVTKSNEPWALWFYNNCKWTMHAFGPVVVGVAIPAHTYMCHRMFYSTSEYIWLEPLQWALAAIAFVMLIMTNQVDPGTVPGCVPDADEDFRHGERRGDSTWCNSCGVWRPKLSKHCSLCERCILDHDHHCGVMGTCIAQSSMPFFNGFLLFVGLACTMASVVGLMELWQLRLSYTPSSFPYFSKDFYITGFFLVGCCPLYLGTVWLQIFMYGFVAMNIVTWANKHNHSGFKELALMCSHPIRHRQCGPPQKLGYEPVQTQVSNDSSIEPEGQEVLDMQHVKGV